MKKHLTYSLFSLFSCILFIGCSNSTVHNSTIRKTDPEGKISLLDSCNNEYVTGRSFQREQKFQEAIEHFKKCITFDSRNEDELDDLQVVILNAMIQLMNSYQSVGDPEGCVAYLSNLRDSPTYLIQSRCQRDLYSILGYSLSRTENMELAEETMKKALNMELYNPTDEKYFRDYAYAGAIFFANPNEQEQVIKWCLLALEHDKKSKNPAGAQWLNSMLGLLYKRTGKINESIELFQRSIEEARERKDLLGETNACNSLAELYLYYKLPVYANMYSNVAIKNKLIENPMVVGLSFSIKGQVMHKLNQIDSALYYYQKADSCVNSLPYNSGLVNIDLQMGTLMVESYNNDSLQNGIKKLERVTQQGTNGNRAIAYYQLAKAFIKSNNKPKGEYMLDSMYNILNRHNSPIYIETAYSYALNYYLNKENIANIKKYSRKLLDEHLFRCDDKTNQRLTETIVTFQTEKTEQELKQSKIELEHNKLRLRLYIIYFISFTILLIIIIVYKRRLYRIKQKHTEEEIKSLLSDMQETQQYITTIEEQLSELYISEENRIEIEARIPHLLRERGENKFRQHFEKLYPQFLPILRERVSNIGRKEELLCMLIMLGQDNFQIEQTMGIAHSSVNMARYRLRQKMKLEKSDSLEDAIKRLLKSH